MSGMLRALVVGIFAAGGFLMFTRRLPSLLALPGMAVAVALVALVRWDEHLAHLREPGIAGWSGGLFQLGREGALVAAGFAVVWGLVWMLLREGYERAPEAGRGLALILVALAVGGELHRGVAIRAQ